MSLYTLTGNVERGKLRIVCPICSNRSADVWLGATGRLIAKCLHKTCAAGFAIIKALDLPSRRLFSEERAYLLDHLLHGEHDHYESLPDALPARDLHEWYRLWLLACPLNDADRDGLLARGFTSRQIQSFGYGSWQGSLYGARRFPDSGLPGIHKGRVSLADPKYAGVLIPVRDAQSRIIALKVRMSHPDEKGKMRTFSSAAYSGAKAHYAIHVPVGVPRALRALFPRRVALVEGELKADLVFARTGQPVIGIPGANGSPGLADAILSELDVTHVDLAFDMDEAGHRATQRWAEYHQDVQIGYLTWDVKHKGPDDALSAGAEIRRI